MKKFITLIMICFLCLPITNIAHASESGTFPPYTQSLKWELNDYGVLVISGKGDIQSFANVYQIPWYEYRKKITSVVLQDGVEGIGRLAFYRCINLKTITIPASVTEIYSDAFDVCTSLEKINYNSSASEWTMVTIRGDNSYFSNASLYTNDSVLPIMVNKQKYMSIIDALSVSTDGSIITIQSDYDGDAAKITLPPNIVIDVTAQKNLKNVFITAISDNSYVKMGDIKINGENLYLGYDGKLDVDVNCQAKLTRKQSENETEYGFVWAVDSNNIFDDSNIIFRFSGIYNGIDYNDKHYTFYYGKDVVPVGTKTQFGYVFSDIPNEINVEILEVN